MGFHHPWIFSGALAVRPEGVADGEVVWVADRHEKIIGTGTYSGRGSIAVRLFAFAKAEISQPFMTDKVRSAYARRQLVGLVTDDAGFRLVHGESDGLPGVVVDVYSNVAVMQLSTAGADRLRQEILNAVQEVVRVEVIHEKSDMDGRREEGLEPVVATHVGALPEKIWFEEAGLKLLADVADGQKTGFFLDQRDLRAEISRLANGKTVLNLFSYMGANAVAAMKGGATAVHNVDMSPRALSFIPEQLVENGLPAGSVTSEEQDVFQYLAGAKGGYDMVIMDPPALVKAKKDTEGAMKAYHFLNRAAMRLMKDGGIFITSSCSHFVSEDDLMFVLRRAAVQAGVELSVLKSLRQAPDHPLSIYFPEGLYLKSFIMQVSK